MGKPELIYVIDTCIIMKDPTLSKYKGGKVYVSSYVNSELDNHKTDMSLTGANVRTFFNHLKDRELRSGGGFYVEALDVEFVGICESELPERYVKADDFFVDFFRLQLPEYILHTHDFSLSEKARLKGLNVEWIPQNTTVSALRSLRTGSLELNVPNTLVRKLSEGAVRWSEVEGYLEEGQTKPEGHCLVVLNCNGYRAYGRFRMNSQSLTKVNWGSSALYNGVVPRNPEQEYLTELLLDPEIKVISVAGNAGTGKTFLALAAALKLVTQKDKLYYDILIGKGTMPLNKWSYQGFTKGDTKAKLLSHMSNYISNLDALLNMRGDKKKCRFDKFQKRPLKASNQGVEHAEEMTREESIMAHCSKNFNMEFMDIASIKGASLHRTIAIVDESQEFSIPDMRAIVTRIKDDSKIIILGDIKQQGTDFVAYDKSGFYALIQAFHDEPEFAHITLKKGERGKVADKVCKKFDAMYGF